MHLLYDRKYMNMMTTAMTTTPTTTTSTIKKPITMKMTTKMTKRIHMKSSSLFIVLVVLQMTMIMTVSGLSVGVQNPPTILLNGYEKHQSINSRQAIENLEMNVNNGGGGNGGGVGNTATKTGASEFIEQENIADRMKDDGSVIRILQTTAPSSPSSSQTTKSSASENEFSFTLNTQAAAADDGSSSSAFSSLNKAEQQEIFECGSPENLQKGQFTGYDYAIVLAMLGISLGIGAFYGFFKKSGSGSSNEFLLGSEMSIFPVTLSLTTSFITAIELLGNPSEMFYQGTQFSLIVIPMVLVIPVAVKMFYPIYYKLDLTSCYEYLGIRFGKDLRMMGGLLYIVQMSFYTAVAVLAPAIALSKATGLNTRLAVALIYLVCIFYSSQGGMKAVVIADTFQACVLAGSLVLIVILGTFHTAGIYDIFEKASERNRLEFLNFDPNPTKRHTVFSVVIGGFFYWASLFCTNQASVQKCMSLKSLKLAKLALGFAILGLIVVFLINFYTGLMVFTHYADCDPLSSGQIGATDQLLPFYIMDVYANIYTITGIFVAGIFAASLGTVASALNSLAAVTCEDILINGFNIKIRPEKGALYAKWMSLGYGVFSFILVFVVERLGGVLQATLTLNGLVGGVTLGLFVLGIVFKRANAKGAFYGGIIALVVVIYIGVMAQITNVEPEALPLSMEKCNCFVSNITTTSSYSGIDSTTITAETMASSGIEISTTHKDMMLTMMTEDMKIMNDGSVKNNDASSRSSSSSSSGSGSGSNNQNHIDDRLRRINDDTLTKDNDQGFSFSSIYRISYMWYSMIGTLLTIIFGLLISIIYDAVTKHQILKITQNQQQHQQQEFNSINVSTVSINCGEKIFDPISKLNENLKSHYITSSIDAEQQLQQLKSSKKTGIDNFALKIDDEK